MDFFDCAEDIPNYGEKNVMEGEQKASFVVVAFDDIHRVEGVAPMDAFYLAHCPLGYFAIPANFYRITDPGLTLFHKLHILVSSMFREAGRAAYSYPLLVLLGFHLNCICCCILYNDGY